MTNSPWREATLIGGPYHRMNVVYDGWKHQDQPAELVIQGHVYSKAGNCLYVHEERR